MSEGEIIGYAERFRQQRNKARSERDEARRWARRMKAKFEEAHREYAISLIARDLLKRQNDTYREQTAAWKRSNKDLQEALESARKFAREAIHDCNVAIRERDEARRELAELMDTLHIKRDMHGKLRYPGKPGGIPG